MAGATGIGVTPEQLRTIASQLKKGLSTIETVLANLASAVSPLSGPGGWTGRAGTRYEGLVTKWQQDAKGLETALQGIITMTLKAATGYTTTETSIAGGIPSTI